MSLSKGEARIKSLVPLIAKGQVKYLPANLFPDAPERGEPPFDAVFRHPQAVILHLGKRIPLNGWAAYNDAAFALERPDGSIKLVNGEAKLGRGVVEIK